MQPIQYFQVINIYFLLMILDPELNFLKIHFFHPHQPIKFAHDFQTLNKIYCIHLQDAFIEVRH